MDQLPRLGKRELICLLLFTCNYVVFCLERFPLPLGAWDGLRYFIVALPSSLPYNYFFRNLYEQFSQSVLCQKSRYIGQQYHSNVV